ncbi:hypothetical protein EV127DRAFT_516602 [Xylaria flabelliformis]|nr:hypothetical protein EV127DRAFT_516602 [Xylaria flabelliformis]
MCRRIITHHMHHDVAAAMIIDPHSPNPMVYANILRTNFHRCELTLPNHHSFLPINHHRRCPYHTCCLPYEQIEHCEFHPESERRRFRFEPEECHAFILEHHHERLPYFGSEGPHHVLIPATWRQMVRIQASDEELFPRLGRKLREGGKVFTECEKLYTIHNDTAILHASLRDLRANDTLSSWHAMEAVRISVLESEEKLHRQRRDLHVLPLLLMLMLLKQKVRLHLLGNKRNRRNGDLRVSPRPLKSSILDRYLMFEEN